MDALAQMLGSDGDEILCDPESLREGDIDVRLVEGEPMVSAAGASNTRLLYGMANSLPRIARAYEESGLNRRTRLAELLEFFTAILHHERERFLRDVQGLQVNGFALARRSEREPRSDG